MAKRNFSSKRNAIYETISSTKTHPSARWVYDQLKPSIPDLSLGTVYRNIALFKKEGLIQVICNVNGEERIDADTSSHPHFICNKCGKVYDAGKFISHSDFITGLTASGFVVDNEYILFYGICPECLKNNQL